MHQPSEAHAKEGDIYAGYKPGKHRCAAARQRHTKHAANARALPAVKADLYGYMRSVLPAALRRAERIQQRIFLLQGIYCAASCPCCDMRPLFFIQAAVPQHGFS